MSTLKDPASKKPPATVTSLQIRALEKLASEHADAAANVDRCRTELRNAEVAELKAADGYVQAAESGDGRAASIAMGKKGEAAVQRDVAERALRRAEELAATAHQKFWTKRLEIATTETSWTKVRARIDPIAERFVKARAELVAVVTELQAAIDELVAEQEVARTLRASLGVTAIRAPEITPGKIVAVVVAAASLSARKTGSLGGEALAPWLRIFDGIPLGSYVQRAFGLGLISDSPEGVERAKQLLANGELPRDKRTAESHPAA